MTIFKLTPIALAMLLTGCAVGPDYQRPGVTTPATFKEAPKSPAGWFPAAPADALDRGDWWALFGDTQLNTLAQQVQVSNQNVAAAVASYAQARALVSQQRAALFPSLALDGSARRSGGSGGGGSASGSNGTSLQLGVDASWVPDLWGRLSRAVESAQASAQASEADLAAARLSAQAELATNYFSLRDADTELDLLDKSIEGFDRSFTITKNRYDAGIAAKTDVLQAQTQLANARADRVTLQGQREQLEHAIAVLIGKAPADFSLAAVSTQAPSTQAPTQAPTPTQVAPMVPAVPLVVPSELLQRRPDIAAAERAVAAANAQIGIERSAYFPSLSLSASYGTAGSRVPDLFNASNSLWSLGLSVAQTIFDAGATRAAVQGAEAGRDVAIARYRQTVLAAFQAVEDQLSVSRALAEQAELRKVASEAADQTEQQLLNRYKQGQVNYTDVVTAQSSALSARRTLAQLAANRQAAAVALIQALGGGWKVGQPVERHIETP